MLESISGIGVPGLLQSEARGLVLKFVATGAAAAQGSIRPLPRRGTRLKDAAFKDVILTSDSKDLKRWRAVVRNEARCALIRASDLPAGFNRLRDALWPEGPVRLVLRWSLPRPKAMKAPTCEVPHVVRPDIDKLERAVLDALTGVLYRDDGQVQTVLKQKFYADAGAAAGVEVTAWQ